MDLAHRRQRLELIFENGELEQWYVHHEKKRPDDLGRFDEQAGWIVARGGAL